MNGRVLRILARQSDLARLQAWRVGSELLKVGSESGIKIQYQFRSSLGDQNANDPLWKMPEKGVFTEDFVNDLEAEKADLVVHSWKDLPIQSRKNTEIAATLKREDVRDVLLFKSEVDFQKIQRITILTSSPRRQFHLSDFASGLTLKDLLPKSENLQICFEPVRGNIETRIKKLVQGESYHGIIVAKAALDRFLKFNLDSHEYHSAGEHPELRASDLAAGAIRIRALVENLNFMVLPLAICPAAAAQGGLAIEVRKNDIVLKDLLSKINSPIEKKAIEKEREILASYGGGCHQKIGVTILNKEWGQIQFLKGETDAGVRIANPTTKHSEVLRLQSSEFFLRNDRTEVASEVKLESLNAILFLARSEALPKDYVSPKAQLLLASGMKTWLKLAARGYWVSGSTEGLGEQELDWLSETFKNLNPQLQTPVILTHSNAHEYKARLKSKKSRSQLQTLATYSIQRTLKEPDLIFADLKQSYAAGTKEIFWRSAGEVFAVFDLLTKNSTNKNLKEQFQLFKHSSGPGWTHDALTESKEVLGWSCQVVST